MIRFCEEDMSGAKTGQKLSLLHLLAKLCMQTSLFYFILFYFILYFLFYFILFYFILFMHQRHREAETQTEGEAGSMRGARCGT